MVEEERPITYGIVKPGHGCPGGVPVVKVKDMQDGAIDESNLLLTTPELDYQYRRSRLRTGDLLISIRGSVGRLAEIPESLENANITQDTARLTISPQYNKIYVRGVLESPILQWDMEKNIRGVAVKGINIGYLRELKMPVCSRERQDELAMLYQQSDKSKFNSFKSQFIEMFKSIQRDEYKPLKEVCTLITDGTHNPPKFKDSGIPFILVSNITGNVVTYDTPKYISEDDYNVLMKRTPIEKGDVLLSTVGSYGNPAIVTEDRPFAFQRHIAHLKPNRELLTSEFLHAAILSSVVQEQIEVLVLGVAQKTLNLSAIKQIQIPVPTIEEQKLFVTFVEQSDKSK